MDCSVQYVEFERDIVFKDRRGNERCFYARVIIPLFIHEEELFVEPAGEPEFKMVLKDDREVGDYDWDNFCDAVKYWGVREYRKLFRKKRATV